MVDEALTHDGVGDTPGAIDLLELARAGHLAGQRGDQALTVLDVGPGQRDQRPHGSLGGDLRAPDGGLNALREDGHQRQMTADPARGALEHRGQVARTQVVLIDERPQQPPLFETAATTAALQPVRHEERFGAGGLERQRVDEIPSELPQRAYSSVPVHQHELLFRRVHQHRR